MPNACKAHHLVRKPINGFSRRGWWLRSIPISRSCSLREFKTWVRTKGGKGNLAGVQVIDHGLEAVAGHSGILNGNQCLVSRTLLLPYHG